MVGLGNPGAEYAATRHNIGARLVQALAERHDERLKAGKERALVAEVRGPDGQGRMALAVPQTYMNESGLAVGALVRRYDLGIGPALLGDRLLIVHDDLELPPGEWREKLGGGLAGHNGLRSVKAHLKSDAFARLRLGIGRPPGRQPVADFVLKRPGTAERTQYDVAIEAAADAVDLTFDRLRSAS